jgi:hypothetical protein
MPAYLRIITVGLLTMLAVSSTTIAPAMAGPLKSFMEPSVRARMHASQPALSSQPVLPPCGATKAEAQATWGPVTGRAKMVEASYPCSSHIEQPIDKHQVGWIDLTIDGQGHATLTHWWSNGKQWSGNTFYSIVVLVDKDGKPIYHDWQTKGIDGSGGGHARKGFVTTTFTLTKEQSQQFDHVLLKMGAKNCGIELTSFHCCDHGIEVTFSDKKDCGAPRLPPQRSSPQSQ